MNENGRSVGKPPDFMARRRRSVKSRSKMTANDLKWSSIENVVTAVFGPVARLATLSEDEGGSLDTAKAAATLRTMRDRVLGNRIEASVKIDGTNVGRDVEGNIYGRNQMVQPGADTYQKTSLAAVKAVDVAAVLEKIVKAAEIDGDDVAHFVLYGELVCNKNIYDYAFRGIASGWLVFGAMVRARNDDVKNAMLGKMTEAKFAVWETEEGLRVSVNERFRQLVPEISYAPRVELGETCTTLADLILLDEVYNLVAEGRHEGLVLLERKAVRQTTVAMKWKNGHEPAGVMADRLLAVKKLLDDPGVHLEPIINEVLERDELGKVEAVIDRLLKVFENANKIDLNADGTLRDQTVKNKAEKKGGKKPAVLHPNKVYHEAIQSAKSKFDHCDTFFAKGDEGFEEYLVLIREECHGDVVEVLGEAVVGDVEGREHEKKVREVMEREWKKFLKRSPN